MRDVHITVEVELRRSDGNYGSDRAMCQLSTTCDAGDEPEVVMGQLMDQAEAEVEARLKKSASIEVRRTMLRKARVCNECKEPLGDDEDYLHSACSDIQKERHQRQREEQNAKWQAEQAEYEAQRELVGGGASTDDDDDDEPDEDEDIPL